LIKYLFLEGVPHYFPYFLPIVGGHFFAFVVRIYSFHAHIVDELEELAFRNLLVWVYKFPQLEP
jgi:hypothetical protein